MQVSATATASTCSQNHTRIRPLPSSFTRGWTRIALSRGPPATYLPTYPGTHAATVHGTCISALSVRVHQVHYTSTQQPSTHHTAHPARVQSCLTSPQKKYDVETDLSSFPFLLPPNHHLSTSTPLANRKFSNARYLLPLRLFAITRPGDSGWNWGVRPEYPLGPARRSKYTPTPCHAMPCPALPRSATLCHSTHPWSRNIRVTDLFQSPSQGMSRRSCSRRSCRRFCRGGKKPATLPPIWLHLFQSF